MEAAGVSITIIGGCKSPRRVVECSGEDVAEVEEDEVDDTEVAAEVEEAEQLEVVCASSCRKADSHEPRSRSSSGSNSGTSGQKRKLNRDLVKCAEKGSREAQNFFMQSGDNCFLFGHTNGSASIFAQGTESLISGCKKRRIFQVNL